MRYSQLRAFHHVAETKGFSRAAEAMNVSQPAVSDQISRLERDHDVLLFQRTGKQTTLTEAGKRLFELTREFFDTEARIADYLSDARAALEGELRLIVDSAHHINDILSQFRVAHPRIKVILRTGNSATVMAELRAFRADVGVVGTPQLDSDMDQLPLNTSPIVAFAARELAQGLPTPITLADLLNLPFVSREGGSQTLGIFQDELTARGLKMEPAITAEGREAVRDIVAAGAGIGVIARSELAEDDRLVALPIADLNVQMSETLICLSRRREVRAIRAFMATAAQAG